MPLGRHARVFTDASRLCHGSFDVIAVHHAVFARRAMAPGFVRRGVPDRDQDLLEGPTTDVHHLRDIDVRRLVRHLLANLKL